MALNTTAAAAADQELIRKEENEEEAHGGGSSFNVKSFLWHGGSVYDAWFSCASNQVTPLFDSFDLVFKIIINFELKSFNAEVCFIMYGLYCICTQVAQVLLTLPYSFSQLGMVSGIVLQLFYGIMGSWTAYLISLLYVEYRTRKEKENVSFKNHVIQVVHIIFLLTSALLSSLFYPPIPT